MKFVSLACIFSVVIILFWGCKREPYKDTLPPATNNGAKTFGCIVNGKIWALKNAQYNPFRKTDFVNILTAGYHDNFFFLNAEKYDPAYGSNSSLCGGCPPSPAEKIEWRIENAKINKPGFYEIQMDQPDVNFGGWFYSSSFSRLYNKKTVAKFMITSFDTINNHFAGTFEFTCFDKTNGSPVVITDGRFDY